MNCCQESLTRYIVRQAMILSSQQGNYFAEQMINEAAISIDNPKDLKIITEIGQDAIDMVKSFSKN